MIIMMMITGIQLSISIIPGGGGENSTNSHADNDTDIATFYKDYIELQA